MAPLTLNMSQNFAIWSKCPSLSPTRSVQKESQAKPNSTVQTPDAISDLPVQMLGVIRTGCWTGWTSRNAAVIQPIHVLYTPFPVQNPDVTRDIPVQIQDGMLDGLDEQKRGLALVLQRVDARLLQVFSCPKLTCWYHEPRLLT